MYKEMLLKLLNKNKEIKNFENEEIFNRKNLNYPISLNKRIDNEDPKNDFSNIKGNYLCFINIKKIILFYLNFFIDID